MNDKKNEDEKPSGTARRRRGGRSPEPLKGNCTCGHRSSNHVAFKYACQAPGKRKSYCPCMRFIPRDEINRIPATAEDTPQSQA